MRILGPNCLGLFTAHAGFYGCFSNTLDRALPTPGPLSIVSQSGAFGTHLYYLARERGIGLRYWVSTGNEADVQAAECLSAVVDDPETKVVILYLEGARDGRALLEALEKARRARKPVVAIKVGRSAVGAAAAASHTAALAGGDAVYDAIFRDFGAWRAESAEEAVDLAYAAAGGILPTGKRLGIVTISGGGGILMSDVASDYGLELPPMPEAAQAELLARLPFCAPRNPVDITAQAFNRMDLFASNLEIVVGKGGYDAIVAFFTTVPGSAAIRPALKAALKELRARHPGKLIVLSMLVPPELFRDYEAEGFPIFEDANRAVRAVAGLCFFAESFARPPRVLAPGDLPPIPPLPADPGEQETLQFLRAAGIPVVDFRLCRTVDEAVAAFRAAGGPVVMKIASPDIPHKTEVGGVVVGIADEADVRREFDALRSRALRHLPHARIDGVLVAPMVSGHVEVIVGIDNDPVFGPVVMVGLGGIHAEIFRDTQLALAPVDLERAHAMLDAHARLSAPRRRARAAASRCRGPGGARRARLGARRGGRRPHRQPRHQPRGRAGAGRRLPRPRRRPAPQASADRLVLTPARAPDAGRAGIVLGIVDRQQLVGADRERERIAEVLVRQVLADRDGRAGAPARAVVLRNDGADREGRVAKTVGAEEPPVGELHQMRGIAVDAGRPRLRPGERRHRRKRR